MGIPDERPELGYAAAVRAACQRSLAALGAQIYITTVLETESGWTPATRWEAGITEPVARRVQLTGFVTEDDPLEKAAARAAEAAGQPAANAWDGEPFSRNGLVRHGERIVIGRDLYDRWGEEWEFDIPRPVWAVDGLWALEAAQGIKEAHVGDEIEVRGERCVQYTGEARPADVVGQPGIELVEQPEEDDRFSEMLTQVCVGGDGLVRRVAVAPASGARFKPGLLVKGIERLHRSPTPALIETDERRPWTVVELWDYAREVAIKAPAEPQTPDPTEGTFLGVARLTWRIRREDKRDRRTDP
jgi:hypothetical protein